jgi:hypothetical protein
MKDHEVAAERVRRENLGHFGRQTAKHTPGPWTVKKGHNMSIIGSNGEPVGFCGFGFGIDDVANATLIAAAPEMYAALQAIVYTFTGEQANYTRKFLGNAGALALTALAKAEGRAQ